MAEKKPSSTTRAKTSAAAQEIENQKIELRKVKALEKIANSLDALTIWFEEIEKAEWDERIQYYLAEFLSLKNKELNKDEE
jgi:hypothetical protein